NGDGFADVIVGANLWDGASPDEGRAYVYLGSKDGLAPTPAWKVNQAHQLGARFGRPVAGVGDADGEGYSHGGVGAQNWDGEAVDEGRADLYLGSATGLSTTPAWTVEPTNQAYAYFGDAIASAGDVNGDGFADVVVGAFMYDNDAVDEGRIYLYLGRAT